MKLIQKGGSSSVVSGWRGMRYQSGPKELGGQPKLEELSWREIGESGQKVPRLIFQLLLINSGLGPLHEVRLLKGRV